LQHCRGMVPHGREQVRQYGIDRQRFDRHPAVLRAIRK
jgi:hypothetical protein